jgi:hypothetical protein
VKPSINDEPGPKSTDWQEIKFPRPEQQSLQVSRALLQVKNLVGKAGWSWHSSGKVMADSQMVSTHEPIAVACHFKLFRFGLSFGLDHLALYQFAKWWPSLSASLSLPTDLLGTLPSHPLCSPRAARLTPDTFLMSDQFHAICYYQRRQTQSTVTSVHSHSGQKSTSAAGSAAGGR